MAAPNQELLTFIAYKGFHELNADVSAVLSTLKTRSHTSITEYYRMVCGQTINHVFKKRTYVLSMDNQFFSNKKSNNFNPVKERLI
jgi:hypothetical protein